MKMDQLNRLPEVTDELLSGLKADESLKHRILVSAAETPVKKRFSARTVIALCSLSLLLVLLCVLVSKIPSWTGSSPEIQNIPAGGTKVVSEGNMQEAIDQASGLPAEETDAD